MKLNLGYGSKLLMGYTNVDVCGSPDLLCDLSHFPWPFDTELIDEVYSEHFLEHVVDYEKTVLEMHGILRAGGIIHFKVPHFRSMYFPWHLHNYAFSSVTCRLLCEGRPYQFGGQQLFEEVSLRFNYPYLTSKIINKCFTFLANKFQSKREYLGFPIDEIEFIARKMAIEN